MSGEPIRALIRTPRAVASLRIALPSGSTAQSPFPLAEGANPFVCYATYIDGVEEQFAAHWTCPLFERGGGMQPWSVLGRARKTGVVIHASLRHERYHELACWALMPEPDSRDIPSAGIAFDYSAFEETVATA